MITFVLKTYSITLLLILYLMAIRDLKENKKLSIGIMITMLPILIMAIIF